MQDDVSTIIQNNNINQKPQVPIPVGGEPLANGCPTGSGKEKFNTKLFALSFLVGLMDTFHDFAKGDRIAENQKEVLKKEAARIAQELVCAPITLISATSDGNEAVNKVLKYITNGESGSITGSYERNTVEYFEEKEKYKAVLGQFMTTVSFQDIINAKENTAPAASPEDADDEGNMSDQKSKPKTTGRPELWKELCGEYIPEGPNRANKIATGPALTDRQLKIHWDPNDETIDANTIYTLDNGRRLRIIADFITKYFYPEKKGLETGAFVFDMGSGSIGKIFSSLPQISTSINPLNVSDSAATSMNHINPSRLNPTAERNRFDFIQTDMSKQSHPSTGGELVDILKANYGDKPRYLVQGNVFTWDYTEQGINYRTRLVYESTSNYDKNNCHNFKINVCISQNNQPWQLGSINYNAAEKNGPSVNYLGDLIYILKQTAQSDKDSAAVEINKIEPPTNKAMINITNLISSLRKSGLSANYLIRFLYDIKRCGDWEQSRCAQIASLNPATANTMFCTGDILCSFFSRLSEGNCAWHHESGDGARGWSICLYRSPNGEGVSPTIKQTLEMIRKSKTIELVLDRICHVRELQSSFYKIRSLAEQSLQASYQIDPNKESDRIFGKQIEALCTSICRLGMGDIMVKAEEYINTLSGGAELISKIVGTSIDPVNSCQSVDRYVIGLNYLRDLYDIYGVTNDERANNFIAFMNAPVQSKYGILRQDFYQIWSEINNWPDWFVENTPVNSLNQNEKAIAVKYVTFIIQLLNKIPAGDSDILSYLKIMAGIPSDKPLSGDIDQIWNEYNNNFLMFISVANWINLEATKGLYPTLDEAVTRYANIIGSINPIDAQGKVLDLITQIKTNVRLMIAPPAGVPAINRVKPIDTTIGKKQKKGNNVGFYLGLGDSITSPAKMEKQEDGTTKLIFDRNHRPAWGFRFGVNSLTNLVKALKKIRRSLMDRLGNEQGLQFDDWSDFSSSALLLPPGLNIINGIKVNNFCNESNASHPSVLLGEKGYPNQALRPISFDNQYIDDIVKHGVFGKELFLEKSNSCSAQQAELQAELSPTFVEILKTYCSSMKNITGLGVSSEVNAITGSRRDYANIQPKLLQEKKKIALWLVNLLKGDSFSNVALQNSISFTNALLTQAIHVPEIIELIRDSLYGNTSLQSSVDQDIAEWKSVVGNGIKIIQKVISVPHIWPQVEQEDVDMGGMSGGERIQQKGGLINATQKQIFSSLLDNMFYQISGYSEALINPLIGNLSSVLDKQFKMLDSYSKTERGSPNAAWNTQFLQTAAPILNELKTLEITGKNGYRGVRMMEYAAGGLLYDQPLNPDYPPYFFKGISLYSQLVTYYKDVYNFDIIAADSNLSNLQDIFSSFMSDASDDLAGLEGLPLSSGVSNFSIIINNGIVSNPHGPLPVRGPPRRNALASLFVNNTSLVDQLRESIDNNTYYDEKDNNLINNICSKYYGLNPAVPNNFDTIKFLICISVSQVMVNNDGDASNWFQTPLQGQILNNMDQYLEIAFLSSSNPNYPHFILPSIKIMLALSLRRYFYSTEGEKKNMFDRNKLLQLYFSTERNIPSLPIATVQNWFSSVGRLDLTTTVLQNILQKLNETEKSPFFRLVGTDAASIMTGGKKNKTMKKKKKKRKTKKAKKKRQNKKRKTRVKRDKRKRKKTRGRKKKN